MADAEMVVKVQCGERIAWVRAKLEQSDIKLGADEFADRYMVPAAYALLGEMKRLARRRKAKK